MTFEEWWESYEAPPFGLMTEDIKKAYEAGWNACADLYDETDYSETEYNLGLNDES